MIPDPFAPLDLVSPFFDPALDDATMDFKAYFKSFDPALIKEREGMKAVRFRVQAMKASVLGDRVQAEEVETRQHMLAFRLCVHKVTLADGTVKECPAKSTSSDRGGMRLAPVEWFDEVADTIGYRWALNAGLLAIARAQLPKAAESPL